MSTGALSRQLVVSDEWIARLGRILLVVVLIELLLGGNGYLFQFWSVRFRVLLFPVCVAWVLGRLVMRSADGRSPAIWRLLLAFTASTAVGTLIGLAHGNRLAAILSELKPLSYFPMLLFFATTIRSREDIALVARLVVACGIIQAAAYLLLLAAEYFNVFSQADVFLFLRQSDEFVFRQDSQSRLCLGFFYKAAFHLGVAVLLVLFAVPKARMVIGALLTAALALSMTRGLMLAAVLSTVWGACIIPTRRRKVIALAVIAFGAVLQYAALQLEQRPSASPSLQAEKLGASSQDDSRDALSVADLAGKVGRFGEDHIMSRVWRYGDSLRMRDFRAVFGALDLPSAIIGKGLGAPLNGRDRIEVTYLELFHKQGLLGLSFWLALLVVIAVLYKGLSWDNKLQSLGFMLSALYVYAATATNPFLTGSMGMSVVFISLCVMLVLTREQDSVDGRLLRDGRT
jgi:hypothetical protein